MPNRIIKESIRTSKGVNSLSDFQFRLWVYLITYVDDYGRGSADPELLKGFVFPRRKGVTEKSIADALDSLANMGMIHLYNVDGESFFCFPNWGKHQRIQTKKSRFPEPTEDNGNPRYSTVTHRDSPPESESESEYKSESESECGKRKRACAQFIPPTVEQVREYCEKRGNGIDPEYFIAHYSKQNWRTNGNVPITDWKSCVITWEKRDRQKEQSAAQARPAQTYASSNVFFDMLREEGGF